MPWRYKQFTREERRALLLTALAAGVVVLLLVVTGYVLLKPVPSSAEFELKGLERAKKPIRNGDVNKGQGK